MGLTAHTKHASITLNHIGIGDQLTLSEICTVAAGLNVFRVTGLQTDVTALTGTLRGAYIDVSNGSTAATGTIRGMELKARTEAPGDTGNDVAVLEGLSISADSKGHSVTTMRAAEFILDGKTGGTITEAVGLRIANNLQANKATNSYGLQIYRDSFNYTYDISLSLGGHITGDSYVNQDLRIAASPTFTDLTLSAPVNIYALLHDSFASGHQDVKTTASPTFAGLTLTNAAVIGSNSVVFQPNTDSTTFLQALSAAGTSIFNVDTTNERVGVGTATPVDTLDVGGGLSLTVNATFAAGTGPRIYKQLANGLVIQGGGGTVSDFGFFTNSGTGLIINKAGSLDIILNPSQGNTGVHNSIEGRYQTPASQLTVGGNAAFGVNYFEIAAPTNGLIIEGDVGVGEPAPSTQIEMTGITPYLTLHNSTHEDTDGGRESRWNFKGEQSGGEETTLARIEVGHDGSADDQKGYFDIFINDGDDGDSPTKIFRIDSTGLFTDRWLGSGTNTFLGINVCGAGNLAAGSVGNTAIGYKTLEAITSGPGNTMLGYYAGSSITTTEENVGIGRFALKLATGKQNVAVGSSAGYTGGGDDCVFLGYRAGYWETGSDKLFIDNLPRTNEADGRIKALIYGVFAAAVADQSLTVNGKLNVNGSINSNTLTITASADDTDVSGVNTLFVNTTSGDVTLGGLVGGVDGQKLAVVKIVAVNDLILEHEEGIGGTTDDFFMHQLGDEIIDAGGVMIVYNGTTEKWYDVSHAKHV